MLLLSKNQNSPAEGNTPINDIHVGAVRPQNTYARDELCILYFLVQGLIELD